MAAPIQCETSGSELLFWATCPPRLGPDSDDCVDVFVCFFCRFPGGLEGWVVFFPSNPVGGFSFALKVDMSSTTFTLSANNKEAHKRNIVSNGNDNENLEGTNQNDVQTQRWQCAETSKTSKMTKEVMILNQTCRWKRESNKWRCQFVSFSHISWAGQTRSINAKHNKCCNGIAVRTKQVCHDVSTANLCSVIKFVWQFKEEVGKMSIGFQDDKMWRPVSLCQSQSKQGAEKVKCCSHSCSKSPLKDDRLRFLTQGVNNPWPTKFKLKWHKRESQAFLRRVQLIGHPFLGPVLSLSHLFIQHPFVQLTKHGGQCNAAAVSCPLSVLLVC